MNNPDSTLVGMFADRFRGSESQPALYIKRDGRFQALTWGQLGEEVCQTAAALHAAGVRPHDRVVQYADNSAAWIVNDLAIQTLKAIHVPLHAPLTGEQAIQQIRHAGAELIILGDQQQVNCLSAIPVAELAGLTFLASGPLDPLSGVTTYALDSLKRSADRSLGQRLLEQAQQELQPEAIATILYTSGTTGVPKGVVLTQRNLVSNTLATIEAFGIDQRELRLAFLPFSHVFARTCDLYTWIARGSELALAGQRETILQDCLRIQPTMINGVPYFYQRVHRYLVEQKRADVPGSLHKILGGKIQLCCCGGAALPDYLYDFFQQHEIPLLQGYGLTESSPVISLNAPAHQRRGSAGRPIPGVQVRIADDGEILARGPNIMQGYYLDDAATAQVIRDEWLHTGDYGQLDEDGYLFITGRKKELIVTAGGKNIAPSQLESLLTEDPLIAQAIVIGDGRNYLTALVVPDPDQIKKAIRQLRILPFSKQWVVTHPKILKLYRRRIDKRLRGVSHYEQIRRFCLMDRGFTLDTGEMTPKLSLKRKKIEENCRELIERMYGKQGPTDETTWGQHVLTYVRSFLA